ncbi:DUF4192 domain-containing protein [Cellulosimicrobium marinum]|uniref:DUF4192 domain-containing protein n=1 Tax=Cellulosimicrobium marinum TaxID=1638992 RepID=UPI001E33AFE8|nr:DUF4192 domain-containing protein [Cellulosimicrobium marinum]MCB7137263.1 DUF4192 domain-containing protein [Cellulosimicrobium marinum]
MTTTIRAQGPRDLLAYVPYRLGYRPRDSVVLVGLRGDRARVGLVVRVDTADLADLEHGPQVARTVLGHLVADGARDVVVVAYTDEPDVCTARDRAAVEHCLEVVEPAFGPTHAWVVAPSGWRGLDCTDDGCCPPGGRPLRELESSVVGAHMVLAGARVADSRESALRIAAAGPEDRRRAARAARRSRARRAEQHACSWREDGLAAWRLAVTTATTAPPGTPPVPAALVGRVEAALEAVPVRDAVLLSLVPGAPGLPDLVVQGADADTATAEAIRRIVDPAVALAPDPDVTDPARTVLEAVVAHAVRGRRAPALTLLALVAWWHGDGARAAERVREALGEDPAYRLALLLSSAVEAGVPPGWVRQA